MGLAKEIYETVVEISLGSKTKLFNKIVECKGLTAVRSLQVEQQTLKTTEKVYDILQQTKDVREKMAISKMVKMISQKTSRTLLIKMKNFQKELERKNENETKKSKKLKKS